MNFPTKRRAPIAGASSGMSNLTALAKAKAGIDIASVSRSQEKLEEVAQAPRLCGVKAGVYPLDLAKISSVRERIAAIAALGKSHPYLNQPCRPLAHRHLNKCASLASWLFPKPWQKKSAPTEASVTAICLGAVSTPLPDAETVRADFNRSSMLTPEIVAQSILHIALLPETAALEELTLMPSAGTL